MNFFFISNIPQPPCYGVFVWQLTNMLAPSLLIVFFLKKSASMSHGKECKRYELIGTLKKCFSRNSYNY